MSISPAVVAAIAAMILGNAGLLVFTPFSKGWTQLWPSLGVAFSGAMIVWAYPTLQARGTELGLIALSITVGLPVLAVIVDYFASGIMPSTQKLTLLAAAIMVAVVAGNQS